MNLRTTGLIIRREYLNKVKKKSFLITTLVVPILMAALCVLPIYLMMTAKDKEKKIAVIDRSGIVIPSLESTESICFTDYSDFTPEGIKSRMDELSLDAVLSISEITPDKSVTAEITSRDPMGITVEEVIKDRIDAAVEAYRIESYNIEGLEKILKDVKADVKIASYTMDEEGKETISETGVYAILSMVMGLVIFLFITLFGSMVMSAVIEEKSSRVVEVLVSSVKATELMFGKIIGIALVAITQFLLWIILTGALVSAAGSAIGGDLLAKINSTQIVQAAGDEAAQAVEAATEAAPDELSVVLSTLGSLPIAKILIVFLVFFVLGYLLYASLFAAVGSAVENEGDTQQLQIPLTIPLMIGYFLAIYTFNAPDSSIAFWGSMFPFTSPIVMLARLPFGVDNWEIIVSMAALLVTCILFTWFSAKVYKVGILMFGKKSTWKDLWQWFKQK